MTLNEFMHRIVGILPWREETTLLAMQEAVTEHFPEDILPAGNTGVVDPGVKDGTGAPAQFPPVQ